MHTRITLFLLSLATSFLLVGQTVLAQTPPVGFTPNLFEVAASPGDEVSVRTTFRNGLDTPLAIHARVEDFIPQGEEGGVIIGPSVDDAYSLKGWVRVAPEEAVVTPHGTVELELTIRVPPGTMPRSRWAALVVSTDPAPGGDGEPMRAQISGNILFRVLGEAREELALETFAASSVSAGPPTYVARFRNDGTVHLKSKGTIEVRNVFGRLAATLSLPERNVLPGYARKVDVSAGDGFLFGRYTASLRAVYGQENRLLEADTTFWVIPWKTIASAFFVFMGMSLFAIWKRKTRKAAFRLLDTGNDL